MIKKLLKINPETHRFYEVDPIPLERTAKHLKQLIEEIVHCDDPFGINDEILPLVNRVLSEGEPLPLKNSLNMPSALRWALHEGHLEDAYNNIVSAFHSFEFYATASAIIPLEEEWINGERYAWVMFEELGDWPDTVLAYQKEKARQLFAEFGEEPPKE